MTSSNLQQYFLLALVLGMLALSYFILKPFLAPLALGAVFAVVLQPLYGRILRLLGGRETFSALITVFLCILAILILIGLLGAQLVFEAQSVSGSLSAGEWRAAFDTAVQALGPWAENYVPGAEAKIAEFSASIDVYIQKGLTWIVQNMGVVFSGVSALFLQLFIFFVTLYYLLRDGKRLRERVVEMSPLLDRDDNLIFSRLEIAVNSVVKGKLFIALVQGAFAGVGFALFGVPNPVLWGVIAAFASLIPPLGAGLVIIPTVLYLFLTGSLGPAIGLAIWGGIAGVIDNIIGPKLMGSGMELHPLLVLLSVLGGIALFGPVGVFIGPLAISLLLTLLSIHTYLTRERAQAGN